jgi:DNA-binding NtrC family response regulator
MPNHRENKCLAREKKTLSMTSAVFLIYMRFIAASIVIKVSLSKASVLIEGEYGVGKTRFLELIKPKKRKILWVESLNNIHEILASILQQLDYQAPSSWRRTSKHLKMIKALSGFIIIIDAVI